MSKIRVQAEAVIDARPEDIYAVLADYRNGHPLVLPKQYFTKLAVESGGTGAGTVFNVRIRVYGVERRYHMLVSEPQPGRVLVETDTETGLVTTFTLTPVDGGQRTRVQIATAWDASPGFSGLMERLLTPATMRAIYQTQLAQLAEVMRGKRAAA